MSIEEIKKKLDEVNVYWEVCKAEIETAIEDVYNDELYRGYQDKLHKITDEDIKRLAWKLEDYDIWSDIYEYARELVYEEINVSDDE